MFYSEDNMDSFDREMLPYLQSSHYKRQHASNNYMIEAFSATLMPEQKRQFHAILNELSNEYADFTAAAYKRGLQIGNSFGITDKDIFK